MCTNNTLYIILCSCGSRSARLVTIYYIIISYVRNNISPLTMLRDGAHRHFWFWSYCCFFFSRQSIKSFWNMKKKFINTRTILCYPLHTHTHTIQYVRSARLLCRSWFIIRVHLNACLAFFFFFPFCFYIVVVYVTKIFFFFFVFVKHDYFSSIHLVRDP